MQIVQQYSIRASSEECLANSGGQMQIGVNGGGVNSGSTKARFVFSVLNWRFGVYP